MKLFHRDSGKAGGHRSRTRYAIALAVAGAALVLAWLIANALIRFVTLD